VVVVRGTVFEPHALECCSSVDRRDPVVVGAILPMVDPPGDAPRFLRMTAGCDDATRSELARRIAV
jgi:hypothetical protein